MSIFYIWNPITDPNQSQTIEFVLTQGDADSINKGTKKFFQQVLDDLGVEAQVEKWEVNKYRSKYYTDYLGEDDWRDNWQPVWRAQVTAKEKIKDLAEMEEAWVGTDATDETWKIAVEDDDEIVGCLVVADFKNGNDLKKAEKSILQNEEVGKMQKKYSAGKPQFYTSEVMNKFKQLQIDLGDFPGEFFAKGADYAEYVMKLCRKANGTTHFTERAE
jgi:hypothetical protein